jgi:predicted naringenin-chalcone synthase
VSRHIGFISGERSILDAVKKGLELPADALAASREVLSCFGNMSSAKVMFVLQRMMQAGATRATQVRDGVWTGLTAETMRFNVV